MAMILFILSMFLAIPVLKNKSKRRYNAWMRSRKNLNPYRPAKQSEHEFMKFTFSREL